MKNLITFFTLFFLSAPLFAQENRLFIPREIEEAYEKGTRSYDGTPGENYWQNTVDYTISVEVVPKSRELIGTESVVYHNNSPDKLPNLVVRLYHDVFKEGAERGYQVKPGDINEGVEISRITVNGTAIDLKESTRRVGTNMVVKLPEPIDRNSQAKIEIDWKMVIPETTIRTGAYDSTSFFVAYWYPQIAVYDDVFGWDMLSYDLSTEFYNNLGNFDVTIKAPEEFTIIATGVLQNAGDVLNPDKLELYNQARSSEETITILTAADVTDGSYKNKSGTWYYKATEVTDFSFCLSDHFVWDGAMQRVEDREVFISSYYNINVAEKAGQLTSIQQKTMKHFSEDMPGVPYPYPEFSTCVMGVGGGGMETPMMANNGQPGLGVTLHEMFHTYFPMYVRINEKRFAWMDEGWANFNTTYVSRRYFQQDTSQLIEAGSQLSGTIGSLVDLPLITSTQFMDNANYGYASYSLPEFLYTTLYHHLGEELFTRCYREYILTWAKKSPTPYDFFYTFERVSGQDLSWFWNPWFFRYGNVNISITSINKGKFKIENQGSRPVPVVVKVNYKDGSTWKADYSAAKWKSQNSITVEIPDYKKIEGLTVNEALPDADILDNYHPTIKERYGDFEIAEKYLGEYQVNEYPINVIIDEKDELIRMTVPGAGIETYLIPEEDNTFKDLTGNYELELEEKDDGSVGLNLSMKSYGIRVTGQKE